MTNTFFHICTDIFISKFLYYKVCDQHIICTICNLKAEKFEIRAHLPDFSYFLLTQGSHWSVLRIPVTSKKLFVVDFQKVCKRNHLIGRCQQNSKEKAKNNIFLKQKQKQTRLYSINGPSGNSVLTCIFRR